MILITGGLGYVGSHLCNRLYENNNIIILDNFSNSTNIIRDHKNINIIRGDILDNVDNILRDVDTIIRAAAQTSVAKSIEDPIYMMPITISMEL